MLSLSSLSQAQRETLAELRSFGWRLADVVAGVDGARALVRSPCGGDCAHVCQCGTLCEVA